MEYKKREMQVVNEYETFNKEVVLTLTVTSGSLTRLSRPDTGEDHFQSDVRPHALLEVHRQRTHLEGLT
jgi:hypothetical protein